MDISAIVLHKLLESKDLESYARIKLAFLDSAYSSVYTAINKHYSKYSELPSFEDLELTLREGQTKYTLEAIKLTEAPEVSIDVAIDALIDQYTQNETVRLLDKFVDKIPVYDTTEIKDNLAAIVLALDEKTMSNEGIATMDTFDFFQRDEDVNRGRVMLGFNNDFDAAVATFRGEYVMVGGPRGSGKSIIANNVFTNQYELGNSAAYFTVEMTERETINRAMAILANVSSQNVKNNQCTQEEIIKLAKVRADMFVDANDLYNDFLKHKDRYKLESELKRTKELKPDNQLIVIHDRDLTLTAIDIHLGKLKAKFGDKLTCAVVDYVNQVRLEGTQGTFGKFDWQPQVEVSTGLKNLAIKYDLLLFSPYQVDSSGEARFAKGILDSADIALVMKPHPKEFNCMGMATTKIRSGSDQEFTSGMDWTSLRMSPTSVQPPKTKEKSKKEKEAQQPAEGKEKAGDVPW